MLPEEDRTIAVAFGITLKLVPPVRLLLTKQLVSGDEITESTPARSPVTTIIRRLRQKFSVHNIRIESHYGSGYSVSPEDRERALAVINARVEMAA